MDEQNEGVRPDDEDVEGHLLKEGAAAAAVAGAIFAGSAQARPVDPGVGPGGELTQSAQPATSTVHKQKKPDHHQRQRNRADTEKDG
jgi:hypothetical protein